VAVVALKAGAVPGLLPLDRPRVLFREPAEVSDGGGSRLASRSSVFTLMTTWKRGRAILRAILQRGTVPIDMFLADVERRKPSAGEKARRCS
jgi:K+ transporter